MLPPTVSTTSPENNNLLKRDERLFIEAIRELNKQAGEVQRGSSRSWKGLRARLVRVQGLIYKSPEARKVD